MSKLLDSIKQHYKIRPDQAKLTETSLISDIQPLEIRELLTSLYKEKDLNLRLLASVLNSIFTQHRAVFLFSREILIDLIKKDKNIKRKAINGNELKSFLINTEGKFIKRLSDKTNDHKAQVYKLVHDELFLHLVLVVSNAIIEEQTKQCLIIFNSYEETSSKTSSKTSTEMNRNEMNRNEMNRNEQIRLVNEFNYFSGEEKIKSSNPENQDKAPCMLISSHPEFLSMYKTLSKESQLLVTSSDDDLTQVSILKEQVSLHLTPKLEFNYTDNYLSINLDETEYAITAPEAHKQPATANIKQSSTFVSLTSERSSQQSMPTEYAITAPEAHKHTPIVKIESTPTISKIIDKPSTTAILATWKPNKPNYKDFDSLLEDLFITLKSYGYDQDEVSDKSILKAMSITDRTPNWCSDKAKNSIQEQRALCYSSKVIIKQAEQTLPQESYKPGKFNRKQFITDAGYDLWYETYSNGNKIWSLSGDVVEYYEQQAYAQSFPAMNTDII